MEIPLTMPGQVGPSSEDRRRGRRHRLAFAAAGVLVAGGVAGVAVTTLSGSTAGAASGSDAVGTFLTALAAEDALGAVDALAPSELRVARSLVDRATSAADGEGADADAARDAGIDIDPDDLVPGLEVELSGLEYDEIELSPSVHRVDLRAMDVAWSFDPRPLVEAIDVEQLTGGAVTREQLLDDLGDLEPVDGSFDERDLVIAGIDPFLMTVEEEGGWYVSPLYTVLEYVRRANDLPPADFDEVEPTGAATQAEAIEATIEAWGRSDVGGIIDALPVGGYRALHAYRDVLDELAGDTPGLDVDATVRLDATTPVDAGLGTGMRIDRGTIEIEVEDGYGRQVTTMELDGGCVEMTSTTEFDGDEGDGADAEPTRLCLDALSDDPDVPFAGGIPGIDSFWLVMVEEDGGWYLDPLATFVSWIEAIDTDAVQAEMEELLDEGNPFGLDELPGSLGG